MQEDDLKIDVGEADEQETEIDLDAAPVSYTHLTLPTKA